MATKSKVAVVRCNDYDEKRVREAVSRGVGLLGGVGAFVKSGEKIVLKPNILVGEAPERCVNTHHTVFSAVGSLFKEAGAVVSYGDSPMMGSMDKGVTTCGIKEAAEKLGFAQADFGQGREVTHEDALLARKLTLANGALDADGLISLSKLKAHALTGITGAVKNQFGCVPGNLKLKSHARMPNMDDFSAMLVDINTFLRPRLYVMDAITAMEGNARGGKTKQMNALLFSRDPVALDAVACKMIDLNPEFVSTSRPGEKSGLGTYHLENIEAVGDPVEQFVSRDFDVERKPPIRDARDSSQLKGTMKMAAFMMAFQRSHYYPRPAINRKKCTSCGTCVGICPVENHAALNWASAETHKDPRHNYTRCIRCFCCQEACAEGAITEVRPLLYRVFAR